MLHVPTVPEFLWYLASTTGQPTATFGTVITPAQNAYGSYTELLDGSLVTEDVWRIRINANTGSTAGSLRDMLITLGIDPTAGTSYIDLMQHLLVSDAAGYLANMGGVWYDFPFFIPAGSSIAVKASVNNATVGSVRCFVELWGRPKHPEITPLGRIFRTFGEVTGSSRGTIITPGTTSEGTPVQLGSATTERLWYWEFGYGCGDATMTASVLNCDILYGDASNKQLIIPEGRVIQTGTEQISKCAAGEFCRVPIGSLIYGRAQGEATPDTNHSLMAYGVG